MKAGITFLMEKMQIFNNFCNTVTEGNSA